MASNEIDPRFFLPPGVVDLSYSDTILPSSDVPLQEDSIDAEVTDDAYIVVPEDYAFDDENAIYPPDSVVVVSQTVKGTVGGGFTVDVVIDVPSSGAEQFEVRLTK